MAGRYGIAATVLVMRRQPKQPNHLLNSRVGDLENLIGRERLSDVCASIVIGCHRTKPSDSG